MTTIEQMLSANRPTRLSPTKKHEAFAREYLIDFDMVRAYKVTCAINGEEMEDIVAHKAASRLLNSVAVQVYIDRYECEIISQQKLRKEDVINQLQRVYTKAMKDRDYAAANSALDKLMKHFGLYDKHQRQKRYSADELVGIRRKLEENGVVFESPNRPIAIESSAIGNVEDSIIENEEII